MCALDRCHRSADSGGAASARRPPAVQSAVHSPICAAGAAIAIQQSGWSDTVVWNPYTTMEACYEQFVCVESAKTKSPVTLGAGEDWRATANFSTVVL